MTARLTWLLVLLTLATGCGRGVGSPSPSLQSQMTSESRAQGPVLYQYSTLAALMAGNLEGQATVADMAGRGDFGLGTYNGLDGEMVVLDGVFYQADTQLRLHKVPGEKKVPFLDLVRFAPQANASAPAMKDLSALGAWLDAHIASPRLFAAAKIQGDFTGLLIRSVPGFTPPYPGLAEAIKKQSTKTLDNAQGTLVGIRCPAESAGPAVPGWHFHFVSQDKSQGGHVLATGLAKGRAEWMSVKEMLLEMPPLGNPTQAASVPGESAGSSDAGH